MARPVREPRTPTPLVPALLRFARRHGALAAGLTSRFDLPEGAAEADEVGATPSTLQALFEAVADACGEPWVGLRLAVEPPVARAYAPLGLAMRSSVTVGDALAYLAHHAPLVHPQIGAAQLATDDGVRWIQSDAGPVRGVGRHGVEYGLAFVLARCREVCTGDPLHVSAVWFAHARPRDVAPLERFFGTHALQFGADDNGFALRRELLHAPLARRSTEDAPPVAPEHPAPPPPTTALVTAALPNVLASGATLEVVARGLAVSERTLQRRLEEEGTTFLEVLDRVREGHARDLLREPTLSLVDVAERLGFSDLATFSRAFKRWTGKPPGLFRRTFAV